MKIFYQHLFHIKKSEIRRNISLLIGGNGIAQVVSLIIYPFIARLFSPSAFGQLAVLFSIHSLMTTVASGRYELAVVLPAENRHASALISIGLRIALILSVLITPALMIIDHLSELFNFNLNINGWFYLLSLTVFMAAYAQLLNGWCIRFKLVKILVGASLMLNISTAFIKLGLGFLHIEDGLLYSFVIAQVLMTGFLFLMIQKSAFKPNIQPFNNDIIPVAKTYINFPKYTLAISLLNTFSTNLPVYLLAIYFSNNLTGQFSMAFALLFKPVILYNGSVYQVLMQRVIEMHHKGKKIRSFVNRVIFRTLLIAILAGVMLFFLVPLIIRLYLGNNWDIAISLCRVMIPWAILSALAGPLAFIPNMFNRQFKSLVIDIFYLLLRLCALAIGILLKNAILAIGLFAFAGVVVIFYQLMWYRKLLIEADQNKEQVV